MPMPSRRRMLAARTLALGLFTAAPLGCGSIELANPAYPLTNAQVREQLATLKCAEPATLERPVVVLAGYRGVPSLTNRLASHLALYTGAPRDQFFPITYTFGSNMDNIAELIVARVDRHWPSDDPDETIEVDVVGISMGGLMGRYAAMPAGDRPFEGKRLKIRRLFTIASPHRGALLADKIALDKAAKNMKTGSAFLTRLDAALAEADYELIPYAVLNDDWVGATRTAPPGFEPIWSPGRRAFSHFNASDDPRILLDIALRLRGDAPVGQPSTPPSD